MDIIGVTNRNLCNDFYEKIRKIASSNLKYLILREKDLSNDELFEMAYKIKGILDNSNVKLIINNNIYVAEKVNAYGVQLSYKYFNENIRNKYKGIIGISIHSFNEALKSQELGADYLLYGHVYETECKKGLKPRGLEELRKICEQVIIPVYGIGGINEKNYMDVLNVGAKGIAVMSSLMK